MAPVRLWGILLLAVLVALAGLCPAKEQMIAAGSEKALWLVRGNADGKTHDVVVRPADGQWRWVAKGVTGKPAAATVTGKQLHLLLSDPLGYLIYDMDTHRSAGPTPNEAFWPSDAAPVAICQAAGLDGSTSSAILAVVPRGATSATTARAIASAEHAVRLGVFRRLGSKWKHIGDYPDVVAMPAGSRLLAATVDGELLVMVSDPAGRSSFLAALEGGNWRRIDLAGWPEPSSAVALVPMPGRAVFVLAGPDQDESSQPVLRLAIYDVLNGSFSLQSVGHDSKAVVVSPADTCAARLADLVVLVRGGADRPEIVQCDLNGQVIKSADLDIFQSPPPDNRGQDILNAFMWGLVIAIVVPMVFLRPREPAKPFGLPAAMRPANPIKRVLAAMLDLMPCAMIAWLVFPIEAVGPDQLWRQLTEVGATKQFPAHQAYFVVTSMVLHTCYCVFMEWRFSATVGKRIFRMHVVGDAGTPPGLRSVLLRNMVRIFELSLPVVGIPILLMILTRNRQRLGDMIARTTVVNADTAQVVPPELPSEQPVQDDRPDNQAQ